jgi:hypothetical protein
MTVRLPADTMPGLDAVTDADREWFEARPSRLCRLRPTTVAELFPGEVMRPGSRTVVVTFGSPLVRMRFRVGRPPVGLRQDTDRSCAGLLLLLARVGYTIEGRPLLSTLRDLRQQVGTVLASQP